MSIQVNCECGRSLNLKDELEGKRIKCPSCKNSLLVTADEPGSGVRKKRVVNGKSNGNGEKKGSGMMMFAIAGVGVALLGCCCLGGVGGGAWWYLGGGGGSSSALEKKIVGKWVGDVAPPKKGEMKIDPAFGSMIEFKADGTVLDASPMTPILQGKWKTVSSKADVITVELSDGPVAKKLDIKVVSDDSLKITPDGSKTEFAFKRSK